MTILLTKMRLFFWKINLLWAKCIWSLGLWNLSASGPVSKVIQNFISKLILELILLLKWGAERPFVSRNFSHFLLETNRHFCNGDLTFTNLREWEERNLKWKQLYQYRVWQLEIRSICMLPRKGIFVLYSKLWHLTLRSPKSGIDNSCSGRVSQALIMIR